MDMKRAVQNCDECQLNKLQLYLEPSEGIPTRIEDPFFFFFFFFFFLHLDLDIIGPLLKTKNNNQYIMITVD